jgi:hypothetical protein
MATRTGDEGPEPNDAEDKPRSSAAQPTANLEESREGTRASMNLQ